MLRTFLPVLALFGALSSTSAASNRTIDDQTGDSVTGARPVYQPAADWKYGPDCSGCFIGTQTQLDKGKVFAGSWHDVTAGPGNVMNVTLSFTGTAIYIFCIIPNNVPYTTTTLNATFELDGVAKAPYLHKPDMSSSTIQYDVPVLSLQGLPNTPHTLVMSPTAGLGGDLQDSSLMLFDYAIYTSGEEAPSGPPASASSSFAGVPAPSPSAPTISNSTASTSSYVGPSFTLVSVSTGSSVSQSFPGTSRTTTASALSPTMTALNPSNGSALVGSQRAPLFILSLLFGIGLLFF